VLTVRERYINRTPRSQRAFANARATLAGGVAADIKMISPHPVYVDHAQGSHVVDIDGNDYVDLRIGASSLILGHRPPAVVQAIRSQLDRGLLFSLPTELDAALAARIQTHMPHLERIRFVNSGSEATNLAVRAARAFTGRTALAKFEGGFHGQANDNLLVSTGWQTAGPEDRPVATPGAAGLAPRVAEDVLVLPFNDIEHSVDLIRNNGDRLAAVVLEPVLMAGATNIPKAGFLQALREVTTATGALLVFDEMITGFRLALGGASEYFGVVPDLTALGKVIGGGMPIGAYGGRADVMHRAVLGEGAGGPTIRQSGTFSAHPLAMAAGVATLGELGRRDVYPELAAKTSYLRSGIATVWSDGGLPLTTTGIESIFHLLFLDGPPRTRRDSLRADRKMHHEFCLGMLSEGVFLMPGQAGFLSTAHSYDDLDHVIRATGAVARMMAVEHSQPGRR